MFTGAGLYGPILIVRPLAQLYRISSESSDGSAAWVLPEQLEFRDLFVVKYSTTLGGQHELGMHMDGSVFSFNILLSHASAFDGGGTYFEPTAQTVRPPQGSAVCHSGQVRHSGLAITRGERYLLVGFVALQSIGYTLDLLVQAEHDAYRKFADGCWDRSPGSHEPFQVWPEPCFGCAPGAARAALTTQSL